MKEVLWGRIIGINESKLKMKKLSFFFEKSSLDENSSKIITKKIVVKEFRFTERKIRKKLDKKSLKKSWKPNETRIL